MRLKLEGKNYIEQYVYALTHELKSPLAAIRGAAEILHENPPPDIATRFTNNILAQNARMQLLVEKLLQQAKLENRQEVVTTSIPVDVLFRQLEDDRSVVLAAKNLTLECDAGQLVIEADAGLLSQALGNLLDNAIDFTPRGDISLRARERDAEHVFTVCDNGRVFRITPLSGSLNGFTHCRARMDKRAVALGWPSFRKWRVCIREPLR
jgi:two-component system sensor histidine kinase CreC